MLRITPREMRANRTGRCCGQPDEGQQPVLPHELQSEHLVALVAEEHGQAVVLDIHDAAPTPFDVIDGGARRERAGCLIPGRSRPPCRRGTCRSARTVRGRFSPK